MRTSMNIQNKLTMLSEMTNDSKFQVLEFDCLEGADRCRNSSWITNNE